MNETIGCRGASKDHIGVNKKLGRNASFVLDNKNKREYKVLSEKGRHDNKSFSNLRIPKK